MDVNATTSARSAAPAPRDGITRSGRADRPRPPQRTARPAGGDALPLPEGEVTFRARVADLLREHSRSGADRTVWSGERSRLHNDALHYGLVAERWRTQLAADRGTTTVLDA